MIALDVERLMQAFVNVMPEAEFYPAALIREDGQKVAAEYARLSGQTGEMTADEWRRAYFAALDIAQKRINELEAEASTGARALAGHRFEGEHDCFLSNCKDVGRELERLRAESGDCQGSLDVERLTAAIKALGNRYPILASDPTDERPLGHETWYEHGRLAEAIAREYDRLSPGDRQGSTPDLHEAARLLAMWVHGGAEQRILDEGAWHVRRLTGDRLALDLFENPDLPTYAGGPNRKWPAALSGQGSTPGQVRHLGLSEEQAAILTDLLASRQQTVSEWLGDVLMDMGLGRATGKDYPPPVTLSGQTPEAAGDD